MKIMANKFLIIVVFLLSTVVNAQDPPCPSCPPGPPELPIDDNLVILLIVGASFGMYAIYKYKLKTKASM
ncbi:hypothetical protein [Flavobacterium piscis]|uniref:Signal peptidase n=1 Tax=Flavobacterium piscis TaxID=1114874 RepID=A0ABU1Y634_9FLAO|nr:hypothetical protein [Flavobacterium piscis]MDR7209685.1 hypothetical protein [Flavobacterium piscis]